MKFKFASHQNNQFCSSNLFDGASETLSSSEGCLRYYVVDPALQACNKYLKCREHNVTFYPGEIEPKAMAIQ
jgi:hypothetical protein